MDKNTMFTRTTQKSIGMKVIDGIKKYHKDRELLKWNRGIWSTIPSKENTFQSGLGNMIKIFETSNRSYWVFSNK